MAGCRVDRRVMDENQLGEIHSRESSPTFCSPLFFSWTAATESELAVQTLLGQ